MITDDERVLVEAILTRGLHSDEEMAAASDRLGNRRSARLVAATFTEVFDRKFTEPLTVDEIAQYAKRLADNRGTDSAPVNQLVIEALMRAQLGDAALLRSVDVGDLVSHQVLLAYDLFASMNPDEKTLNNVVAEVAALAAES